jgi:hypothetical protein
VKSAIIVFALVLLATPVWAGQPAVGNYYSYDLPGGTFHEGRFSESWVGGGHGQLGNTINAQSWDGMTYALGTDWKLWCPSIFIAPVEISNTIDGTGSGEVVYRTTYQGGYFWLSMDGPWGDNTEDYEGPLDFFIVTTTYLFVFGENVGIRSNVTCSGPIDGYTDCMTYEINNAAFWGDTDSAPLPADYPEFLDDNCDPWGPATGGWGSVTEITIVIRGDCDVPVQETTWGKIKALYSE